jgi:hypothetical protein
MSSRASPREDSGRKARLTEINTCNPGDGNRLKMRLVFWIRVHSKYVHGSLNKRMRNECCTLPIESMLRYAAEGYRTGPLGLLVARDRGRSLPWTGHLWVEGPRGDSIDLFLSGQDSRRI